MQKRPTGNSTSTKTSPEEEWIPIYYLAFANDPHQESFYTDLLAALREIRDRERLDDDRYLELIAVFVQSIRYETDASIVEPKFPIETYVDGEGGIATTRASSSPGSSHGKATGGSRSSTSERRSIWPSG